MKNLKIVIARNDDKVFNEYLKPSLDVLRQNENIKIAEIFNEKDDSIFKKYNRGVSSFEETPDDVFCFIHEDVRIHDKFFFEKVKIIFESDESIGVLGLIGTKHFSRDGGWWLCPHEHHAGHLIQGLPNGTTYHFDRGVKFDKEMVSVDGFCFFVSGRMLLSYKFDDETYKNAYHFYDVDTCFSALNTGYKVAVADILLEHKSEGPMPENWSVSYNIFLNKWNKLQFPVTVNSFMNK